MWCIPVGKSWLGTKDAVVQVQRTRVVMTITLLPMKRTVLMGIKKPDDYKTSVLWIIRLFGGSPCGPIARYVLVVVILFVKGGWFPSSYLFRL
jgi:hypothetical protein